MFGLLYRYDKTDPFVKMVKLKTLCYSKFLCIYDELNVGILQYAINFEVIFLRYRNDFQYPFVSPADFLQDFHGV